MKKILMMCFTLCLIAVVGGCSYKTNKFEIAYEGKGGFGFDEDKLTYCISEYISTKEELKALSKKLNNGYFDEFSTSYNSSVGLIIRNYDDVFFNDNNLIVCVIDGANSFDYSVNKLDVSNNKLIINIKKAQKKGTFTDEAFSYLFIIEVEKKEFLNINYVETIIK